STRAAYRDGAKRVYYLSLEFLIGRLLRDAVWNLGMTEALRDALAGLNVDLDVIAELEPDAALGNGGLGRLAACFMESMASVGIPSYGYGIRYCFGLFRQLIKDGRQEEGPELWLTFSNPWEIERTNVIYNVGFGGSVEIEHHQDGTERFGWHSHEFGRAGADDSLVVGWLGAQINTLRLWSARAVDPLRLSDFNRGDHIGAV